MALNLGYNIQNNDYKSNDFDTLKNIIWANQYQDKLNGHCYVCGYKINYCNWRIGYLFSPDEIYNINDLKPICQICKKITDESNINILALKIDLELKFDEGQYFQIDGQPIQLIDYRHNKYMPESDLAKIIQRDIRPFKATKIVGNNTAPNVYFGWGMRLADLNFDIIGLDDIDINEANFNGIEFYANEYYVEIESIRRFYIGHALRNELNEPN